MFERKNERWLSLGWVLLAILVAVCVGAVVVLLRRSKPIETDEQKSNTEMSRVVTKQTLQAFTLLTGTELEERKGVDDPSEGPAPKIEELKGRYLLIALKRRGEVKPEMVAPKEATASITAALLEAVAVAIPATASNTLGGSLQTGDIVDLLVAPPRDGSRSAAEIASEPKKFENLLVIGIGPKADEKTADRDGASRAITFALKKDQLRDFALSLPSGTLIVIRKDLAPK